MRHKGAARLPALRPTRGARRPSAADAASQDTMFRSCAYTHIRGSRRSAKTAAASTHPGAGSLSIWQTSAATHGPDSASSASLLAERQHPLARLLPALHLEAVAAANGRCPAWRCPQARGSAVHSPGRGDTFCARRTPAAPSIGLNLGAQRRARHMAII
ncbi:uncharacterized protein [Triticum aestivum]|uniref:uncharacterized protein n=1 Tax=Triticum aestivum TaxID=4565 RepID=UPI001D012B2C|nr:uncharacterized protein LOC123071216 [Triticum aestivum]